MDTRKIIAVILSAIIFIVFIVVNTETRFDRKEVVDDHSLTQGWIVRYSEIGTYNNPSLEYNYSVQGKVYSRTIAPRFDFSYCQKNINDCKKKRYYVIYSNSDHSKSLIDLKHDFEIFDKLKFASKLDDFE